MSETSGAGCLPVWPCALGGPLGRARIRSSAEDFVVDEILGFEPSGAGEHVLLRIEKRGENTEWVARELARFGGVSRRGVGYAGLKDRNGRTTQWFSVHHPAAKQPDWNRFVPGGCRVLEWHRHARKLRKGALSGNRFEIKIASLHADPHALDHRLKAVAAAGVPNYFGPQRFGRNGANTERAIELFRGDIRVADRHLRGIYFSAARAFLFNRILAARVCAGTWERPIPGDALMLDGTRRYFKTDDLTDENLRRAASGDVHPTGALWGDGPHDVGGEAAALERDVISAHDVLARGLEHCGLQMARRALRLPVGALAWQFLEESVLSLSFTLPAGAYATAVLRELIDTD